MGGWTRYPRVTMYFFPFFPMIHRNTRLSRLWKKILSSLVHNLKGVTIVTKRIIFVKLAVTPAIDIFFLS